MGSNPIISSSETVYGTCSCKLFFISSQIHTRKTRREMQLMERMKFPVAVHLFLVKDHQILLLRRYNTGYEDGNYSVIAGHLDGGEDVYTAMIREAKEEAGIDIRRNDLEIVQVMHRKKHDEERVDYFFACCAWQGEITNREPNKCDELKWYDQEQLPLNVIDYIDAAIKNYGNQVRFSTFGWE